MAYRHHNAARARWLGVGVTIDEELKARFRERVQAISRPSQDKPDEADTATDDSPVTDNRTYQDKS